MHAIYYQLANQLAALTLRLATITRDNSMSAASVIRVNGRYAGSLPRSSGIEAEAKLHDIKPGSVGEKGLRTAANKGASSLTPEQHQALLQYRAELEKFVTASGRNVTPAQRRSAMHGISIIDKHLERYNAAKAKATPAPRTAMKKVDLKPLPGADLSGFGKLNSLSGVNPVFELKSYGAAQLPTALAQYGKEDLKSATKTLLAKYPGLTPPNRASKSAMVNFLAKHTINPAEAAKQSEAGLQAKAAASTKPRKGK